jgi:hypothetical protein
VDGLDGRAGSEGAPEEPRAAARARGRGKKKEVTDGPYVEVKDLVAGFMVIEARDLAQAVKLSTGCPILEGETITHTNKGMTG